MAYLCDLSEISCSLNRTVTILTAGSYQSCSKQNNTLKVISQYLTKRSENIVVLFSEQKRQKLLSQSFINHKLIIDDYYVIHLLDSSMEKYSHRLPNLEDKISAQLDRTSIKNVFVLVQFQFNGVLFSNFPMHMIFIINNNYYFYLFIIIFLCWSS